MYKIMFIDDDPLIVRRLHQIINWTSMGFEIPEDASDGNEALDKISQNPPDIIICDINMPNMDGLTLAEKIKSSFPHIEFIILTVNDSFGCAQQALNTGVDHYLLKPIDPEELGLIIKKILKGLESSQQERQYLDTLKDKALLSEHMIREKFLNWLVSGRQPLSEEQIRERFAFYQIPISGQEFQVLSVHINSFTDEMTGASSVEDLIEKAKNTIEDSLYDYQNWVVFSDSFYNLIVIFGFQDDRSFNNPSIELIGQMIRNNLLFHLNLPVTVFYSRKYQGARNLYCCYYDTKFLYQYTPSVINKGVLSFDEYIRSSLDSSFNFDTLRSDALKHLRSGGFNGLLELISSTLMRALAIGSIESFNMLRIDFVMTGVMFLQENRIAMQDVFQKHFSPLAEILEYNDAESCISFLKDYFRRILEYIDANKISPQNKITEKCMELITENISYQHMSVKWLASQLYINENYLSRLFKSETGLSLNRYITKQRMQSAKNYLDQGCTNLQQVSSAVGFSDPFYFSKCFKKEYGVAPSKYLQKADK